MSLITPTKAVAASVAAYGEVVLLSASATKIAGTLANRRAVSIQNNGPNGIRVGFDQNVTATTGMLVPAGSSWSLEIDETVELWGIALTVDQVSGAATNWAETA